eukprot:TRINITY_DN10907_c0_g2_i3.p1 TRINITY_DN10907_c0_g2~~TRINITY_DN10907_c0_g2_i3.p1  ORF type:complete len:525 (-),score=96.64 TRINITY_DN10907_c0_g2_i3:293-1867(-)
MLSQDEASIVCTWADPDGSLGSSDGTFNLYESLAVFASNYAPATPTPDGGSTGIGSTLLAQLAGDTPPASLANAIKVFGALLLLLAQNSDWNTTTTSSGQSAATQRRRPIGGHPMKGDEKASPTSTLPSDEFLLTDEPGDSGYPNRKVQLQILPGQQPSPGQQQPPPPVNLTYGALTVLSRADPPADVEQTSTNESDRIGVVYSDPLPAPPVSTSSPAVWRRYQLTLDHLDVLNRGVVTNSVRIVRNANLSASYATSQMFQLRSPAVEFNSSLVPRVVHGDEFQVTDLSKRSKATLQFHVAAMLNQFFTLESGDLYDQPCDFQVEAQFIFPLLNQLKQNAFDSQLVAPARPALMFKNTQPFVPKTDVGGFAAAFSERLLEWSNRNYLNVYGGWRFSFTVYHDAQIPILFLPSVDLPNSAVIPASDTVSTAGRHQSPVRPRAGFGGGGTGKNPETSVVVVEFDQDEDEDLTMDSRRKKQQQKQKASRGGGSAGGWTHTLQAWLGWRVIVLLVIILGFVLHHVWRL